MDPSKPATVKMPLKTCIVAPCFNEAAIGQRFVAELEQVLGSLGTPCTILIVDDGSTDGTAGVITNYTSRAPNVRVEVLALPYNMGHQLVSDRRARMDGRSKMGFKSLSIHAFKSLVEYGDEVLALLLKGFFGLAVLSSGSIATSCTRVVHQQRDTGMGKHVDRIAIELHLALLGLLRHGLAIVANGGSQSWIQKSRFCGRTTLIG
ncbi:MAG: glycosyltransferase [Flavobacteriales bacterium]|nr:glycosyltransferase [Flavobacteriales bacterium]